MGEGSKLLVLSPHILAQSAPMRAIVFSSAPRPRAAPLNFRVTITRTFRHPAAESVPGPLRHVFVAFHQHASVEIETRSGSWREG